MRRSTVALLVVVTVFVSILGAGCRSRTDEGIRTERVRLDVPADVESYTPVFSGALRTIAMSPNGEMGDLSEGTIVSITFSKPMIELGNADDVEAGLITLDPPVPGTASWFGTQTLVFTPSQNLPYATRFEVRVRPGLTSVDGETLAEETRWWFDTPRPRVLNVDPPVGHSFLPPTPEFLVVFNQPVDAQSVDEFIRLDAGRAVNISVRQDSTNSIVVSATSEIPRGTEVTLKALAGLTGTGGPLPLAEEAAMTYRTYGAPVLEEVTTTTGRQSNTTRFDPGGRLLLRFNNPVSSAAVLAALRVTPALDIDSTAARSSTTSQEHSIAAELLPETSYRIRVEGLVDAFGQPLSSEEHVIRTGSYRPSLSIDDGVLVVEAGQQAVLPVSAVNIANATIGMKSVGIDEIVPTALEYSWDYPHAGSFEGIATQPLDLDLERNKWKLQPIELDPFLTGGSGVVAMRLAVPQQSGGYYAREHRAVVQVTRLGVTAKFSPHQNLVFVTSLETGEPVADASVEIRDRSNAVRWSGTTGPDGVAQTPGWSGLGITSENRWTRPMQFAIVSSGSDVAFASSDYNAGIEPWRLGVNYDWAPQEKTLNGVVFSDRGLYRTGEEVSLKGIVREHLDASWSASVDTVLLVVTSPRNERVIERKILPSSVGTFDLSWTIPASAAQGYYGMNLYSTQLNEGVTTFERDIGYGYFRVEAFRTGTFTVGVNASSETYVAGDVMEAMVTGNYLFGAAMADAPVQYSITQSESFYQPSGYDGYAFSGYDYWDQSSTLYRTLARRDTTLNGDGMLALTSTVPGNERGVPTSVVVEASVEDPARQVLSGRTTVTVHPGMLYVGLKPRTTFVDLGDDASQHVDVITVDPNGSPLASGSVSLTLERRQWNSVREVGSDGRVRWRSERTRDVVFNRKVATTKGSAERISFEVEEPGMYALVAEARDIRGNVVRSFAHFYAVGSGYVAWERRDDDIIELVADRSSYLPGETASILVPSPFEGATALVTVEREGILSSEVVKLEGSAPRITVELDDRHMPNAFVSVVLLTGRSAPPDGGQDLGAPGFRIGYANLTVDPQSRRLVVEVLPDQDEYRPGDEAVVNLRLRDASGRGVPGEITFSAADAGVLNLIGYTLPDPYEAFYGEHPLQVGTAESRSHLVRQRNFGQKEQDEGGGGGDGSPGRVRSDFRPSAHWAPAIATDEGGRATVRFRFPESLTTFRLMAVGISGAEYFGAGTKDVIVTQPLVMQAALPRFARVGDEFEAGVLVTNRTGEAGSVTVSARSNELGLADGTAQTVDVPEGGTREIRFAWTADSVGSGTVQFDASMGSERDALAWTIPIEKPLTRVATANYASTESTATEALRLPPDRIPSLDRLNVSLSSTALAGLDGAIAYLFDYMYECLEQQTSRVRPMLIADELVESFGLGVSASDRDEFIRGWINRLTDFWTGDGFSMWPGGRMGNPYVSAYVVAAIAEARQAGYDVPAMIADGAVDALERTVRRSSERPTYYGEQAWQTTRAFMLYALATNGRVLEDEIASLAREVASAGASPESISHIVRAIVASGSPELGRYLGPLVERLRSLTRVEGTTAWLTVPERTDYAWIFGSNTRATALGLTALVEAGQQDDSGLVEQRMINYLIQNRTNQSWNSTQENIHVLEAMDSYYRAFETEEPNLTARVRLAGREIANETFAGRSLDVRQVEAQVMGGDADDQRSVPLAFEAEGTGRLYYSTRLDTWSASPLPPASRGLGVSRTIELLDDQGASTGAVVSRDGVITLEAGSLVRITVHLTSPTDRNYVVVDDALPAGLEALNAAFTTTSVDATQGTGQSTWWGSFNHTEIRDDRVLLFADYLFRGDHDYTYVARATTPGRFVYPGATAELMYEPSVMGRTASTILVVEP